MHYQLPEFDHLDDATLAQKVREGCNDAFLPLYNRYRILVFSIAKNILKDVAEAEEVVQITFLDTYRAINQFDPVRGTFQSFLMTRAYTRSINHRKKLTCHHFYDALPLFDETDKEKKEPDINSALRLLPKETKRLVDEALTSLPPACRTVIELTYFGGYTAEEISKKTGITAVNVRNYLYRSLKKIKPLLLANGAVNDVAAKEKTPRRKKQAPIPATELP